MSTLARWHCTQLDGSGDLKIGISRFSNTSFGVRFASSAATAAAGRAQPARARGRRSAIVVRSIVTSGCLLGNTVPRMVSRFGRPRIPGFEDSPGARFQSPKGLQDSAAVLVLEPL